MGKKLKNHIVKDAIDRVFLINDYVQALKKWWDQICHSHNHLIKK